MRQIFKYLPVLCLSLMGLSMNILSQSPNTGCPDVTIDCPTTLIQPDESFTVTANISSADPQLSLSYNWSINTGTIISGQGTPSITVKVAKPHCQSFTATVDVGGLNSGCQHSASCSMTPGSPPVSRRFDAYGDMAFEKEKTRLDRFAAQLKNEPYSQGYIVFYSARKMNAGVSHERAERSRSYLISARNIDAQSLLVADGGERDDLLLELWIAPQGAAPPPDFKSSLPKCP